MPSARRHRQFLQAFSVYRVFRAVPRRGLFAGKVEDRAVGRFPRQGGLVRRDAVRDMGAVQRDVRPAFRLDARLDLVDPHRRRYGGVFPVRVDDVRGAKTGVALRFENR